MSCFISITVGYFYPSRKTSTASCPDACFVARILTVPLDIVCRRYKDSLLISTPTILRHCVYHHPYLGSMPRDDRHTGRGRYPLTNGFFFSSCTLNSGHICRLGWYVEQSLAKIVSRPIRENRKATSSSIDDS